MKISLSSIWSASLPSALHVTFVCSGFDRLELFLSLYETLHTPNVHRPKYMHSTDCLRRLLFRLAAVAVINSGINDYFPVETIVFVFVFAGERPNSQICCERGSLPVVMMLT